MKGGTKRLKRSKDGKYHCGDVVAKMGIGSRAQVWHETACKTSGGLLKIIEYTNIFNIYN